MERFTYLTPEYTNQLQRLASLLCPLKQIVEVDPLSIPRDEWDFDYSYSPSPYDVEDVNTGFDISGNFHHPRNRWDDMGNYTELS